MSEKSDKLVERIVKEKNPETRAKLKAELDFMPLSSGELDQVKTREAQRKDDDIKAYHKARNE